MVRVCEPVFRNLPRSYTWPLKKKKKKKKKKTDPFIYLIVRNADLFMIFYRFIAGRERERERKREREREIERIVKHRRIKVLVLTGHRDSSRKYAYINLTPLNPTFI